MKNIEDSAGFPDELLARRIEYLSGFITAERYATLCRAVDMRTRYMTVCMENTFHPQNASALVRNCEAFGVQELHAVEELCRFSPNVQIVRGTDKWIEIRKHPTTAELIGSLRGRGYRIVATTPHLDDATPETFDVAAGPFALFFGTEHAGISDEVKAGADEFLRIPMCGMVESLNVSASAAILLYSLSTRVRAMDIPAGTGVVCTADTPARAVWQLSRRDRDEVLYRWMQQTVRDPAGVLSRFRGE